MSSRYATLEDVVRDPAFPEVDVALRRGRHIDRDDGDGYQLLVDAQDHLEAFYQRYRCELVQQSDGYFFLLPSGDQVSHRYLGAGEMLVGQTLALQYLDPASLQAGGSFGRDQFLTRLVSLVGEIELARALAPKKRKFDDERVTHELIRTKVASALRRLASLGFVDLLDDDMLRPRPAVMRFADPVRGLQDMETALEQLVSSGHVHLGDDEDEQGEAEAGDEDE